MRTRVLANAPSRQLGLTDKGRDALEADRRRGGRLAHTIVESACLEAQRTLAAVASVSARFART
jgi:hypothetical protein